MIHESVTTTVLPPSAVCAGEGGGERRRGRGREGKRGRGREGGGERERERGEGREGKGERERRRGKEGGGERGREIHTAPEKGTNVPDTNLSMSLNSRFTESATCLEGITTNNQTKQQLVLSVQYPQEDCLCMRVYIYLPKLQRFNTLTVSLYLHGCCSWVSWDTRGCLLHPSRDQWSATPTPSRREERDRTQRRRRNRGNGWEDSC